MYASLFKSLTGLKEQNEEKGASPEVGRSPNVIPKEENVDSQNDNPDVEFQKW